MAKKFITYCCTDCRYCVKDEPVGVFYCRDQERIIPQWVFETIGNIFPEWCPLEDCEEE